MSGSTRPFIIIPNTNNYKSNSPTIWQKLNYVNNEIDRINTKRVNCPNDKIKQIKLNEKEGLLFNQLIDTIKDGNSLGSTTADSISTAFHWRASFRRVLKR